MTEMTISRTTRRWTDVLRRFGASPADGEKGGRRALRRGLALFLLLAIPLVMLFSSMGVAHADDDEDVNNFSFYKVSSAMTSYFSSSQAPDDGEGFTDDWLNSGFLNDAGSAGSFLGYLDVKFSFSAGWLNSKLSGSSDAISYGTLVPKNSDGDQVTASGGMLDYAQFGAALNGLGLDGTSTGLSLGFFGVITGGIIMGLYFFTFLVDAIFMMVLDILTWLNPFKLFYLGVNAINPEFANGMVGGDTQVWGPLSGLASWIGGWYQVLNSMAWTVMVPLFIGVLLISMLLFKNMNKGSAIKKLFIRLLFIGLGLPLLGSMYTGMLGAMNDATDEGNMGSTRVVLSTYVDFESWAMKNRLYVPEGASIEWNPGAGQPTGRAQRDVRNTTLAINAQALNIEGLDPVVTDGENPWSEDARTSSEASYDSSVYARVNDVIWRYMNGSQITAATFETRAKGALANSPYFKDEASNVKKWFEDYIDDGDLKDRGNEAMQNPLLAVSEGSGLVSTPALEIGGSEGLLSSAKKFTTSGTSSASCGVRIATDNGNPMACNLSPLAMYNYLNTDFGSTSMTMYSSGNVMSEATRSIHNSVNQVGTGTMSFLYWFNAVVLLGSFVVIGIGYAVSMVVSNIRRSFQTITAIPFATLGAIAGIAKVVIYSIALILEVIITIFIYKFVQEFLLSLPQIIEAPFSAILNNGEIGDAGGFIFFLLMGQGFTIVVTLLSIIFVIMFTVMAMRLRKTLVKAMEEATTKLVEKFMDTSVGAPGGGGRMAPALAGGLAAGAGAAAANRMMSGGGSKSGPKTPNAGGTNGPDDLISGPGGGGPGGPPPPPPGGGGSVDGEIDTDGQLALESGDGAEGAEGGAGGDSGNGDPGTGVHSADGTIGTESDQIAEGRRVEAEGLSNPTGGEQGQGMDSSTPGGPGADPSNPRVGDGDAMDTAAGSMSDSAEGYAAADKQKLAAGTEGAKAAGHGAVAVGRGFAGDAAGAAESGGKAVEHGGQAVAAGEQAKATEKEAGRSSLDKPNSGKHQQRAAQAQQVSAAGGAVSSAAGTASASGGATKGAKGAATQGPKPTGGQGGSKTPSVGQKGSSGGGQQRRGGGGGKSPAPAGGGGTTRRRQQTASSQGQRAQRSQQAPPPPPRKQAPPVKQAPAKQTPAPRVTQSKVNPPKTRRTTGTAAARAAVDQAQRQRRADRARRKKKG